MKSIQLFICLIITSICVAQSNIGDYTFVEVPDRFEFIQGDNPYQLSDMMVYYFEKAGIKSYRKVNSPNVSKCNALYADIEKNRNIFLTKLSIVIKDCNDKIIFKSVEGTSKEKEHSKMYPDALRQVFKSFSFKDVEIAEAKVISPALHIEERVEVGDNVVVKETKIIKKEVAANVLEPEIVGLAVQVPQASFSNYTLNGKSYLLKKVEAGFSLFATQEGNDNFIKVGDLSLRQNRAFNMVDIYGENKSGYFNSNQDIVIKLSNGEEVIYTKGL